MATIQRNILIRDKLNVKQNAKPQARSRAADQVIGIRAVNPSTVGIAEKRRLSKLGIIANQANVIGRGMDAAIKLRDCGVPELEAAAKNPALAKGIHFAIDALRAEVDSILREQNAQQNTDDPEEMVMETHGTDAASGTNMSAAEVARIQNARFSIAQDLAEKDNAVNPARVAAGLHDDVDFDPVATMEAKK
ncbi:hypothetical protein [Burkholderia anthina]|uniref:hypothetical protein n=1 Tax=Burkholderia anthina TaxID=179879 RepID=UPI00158EF9E6|nr:hypothetical protein [Burkholderia anthina]